MFKISPQHKRNGDGGFTMIELLVVTTIIIVISTIGLISFRQTGQNARNGKRKADLENIRSALVLYRSDNGSYPNTDSFATMLTTISDYTSSVSVADPTNDATYFYEYSSSGATFTITAYLEPDAEVYTLTNP
jgi:general secretion pathway protein G